MNENVSIKRKKQIVCNFEDCSNEAVLFDFVSKKLSRCKGHKKINDYYMNDDGIYKRFDNKRIWRDKCSDENCVTRPTYGDSIDGIARNCIKHKLDTEEDVLNKKCEVKNCKTIANFGDPNDKIKKRCFKHKLDNDEDVVSKKCEVKNCKTIAIFGDPNDKIKKRCFKHKLDIDENIVSKTCEVESCKTQPVFGNPNDNINKRCFKHKLDDDEDVVNKKCEVKNCKTIASFGDLNDGIKKRCFKHKLETDEDVVSKKCEIQNCKIHPVFGNPNDKINKRCFKHKLDGDEDVVSKKCEIENCETHPIFGNPIDKIKRRCFKHKLDTDQDVVHGKCKTYLCPIRVTEKYEGYCLRCFVYTFPERPIATNYKTKESSVVEYIYSKFPLNKFSWSADKKINNGCSYYRPDLMLDLGYQVIFIEIDENSHKNYDCSCDNKRTMSLSQDIGHRPMIMIRFNPDGYTNSDNEKINSCWKNNKLGLCSIQKLKKWNKRLNTLEENINYWINVENKTNKIVEVIQLYYDGMMD